MDLSDLVGADRIIMDLRSRDKAELLGELARRAAEQLGLESRSVLAALSARERMGSTGLGRGFALPHARLDGVARPFGMLARLVQPIDFAAIDGQPVDLVVLVLIPKESQDHVAALAAVARTMRDEATLRQIRKARSAFILHRHLTGPGAANRDVEGRGDA